VGPWAGLRPVQGLEEEKKNVTVGRRRHPHPMACPRRCRAISSFTSATCTTASSGDPPPRRKDAMSTGVSSASPAEATRSNSRTATTKERTSPAKVQRRLRSFDAIQKWLERSGHGAAPMAAAADACKARVAALLALPPSSGTAQVYSAQAGRGGGGGGGGGGSGGGGGGGEGGGGGGGVQSSAGITGGDGDGDDETPCMVCGRTDGEASFVLCDGCPKSGHCQCMKMPGVPSGDWF
jgi:hypothetical protein